MQRCAVHPCRAAWQRSGLSLQASPPHTCACLGQPVLGRPSTICRHVAHAPPLGTALAAYVDMPCKLCGQNLHVARQSRILWAGGQPILQYWPVHANVLLREGTRLGACPLQVHALARGPCTGAWHPAANKESVQARPGDPLCLHPHCRPSFACPVTATAASAFWLRQCSGVQGMLTSNSAVITETGDAWFNGQKLKLPEGCM